MSKLIMNEPDSMEVRAAVKSLLENGYSLCTVDIALVECLNVIWKHTTLLKDLNPEEARLAAKDLMKLYTELTIIPAMDIQENALDIALSLNITIHDALYVAAAQKTSALLYTADQKLCTSANKTIKTKLLKTKE